MKKYPYSILVFLLAISLLGCGSGSQQQTAETEEYDASSSEAGLLDKVALKDLQGQDIALDAYADKTIVLNFWATWCKPCIIEMPSMAEASEALGSDFVFLLASDESMEKINRFVDKQQIDLPFVQLQNGVQNLQITALPTTWVIKNGEVVHELIGARDWNTEENIAELRNL